MLALVVVDFLLPGFLGDRKQFGRRYRGPIRKAGNTERQTLLAQRVAPFLLRRTKEQVAADLPSKTEITETVEMESGRPSTRAFDWPCTPRCVPRLPSAGWPGPAS